MHVQYVDSRSERKQSRVCVGLHELIQYFLSIAIVFIGVTLSLSTCPVSQSETTKVVGLVSDVT